MKYENGNGNDKCGWRVQSPGGGGKITNRNQQMETEIYIYERNILDICV